MIKDNIYKEIEYLKESISRLEKMNINMKLALLQISIELGWSDSDIKNVIGAFDDEILFFRNSIK